MRRKLSLAVFAVLVLVGTYGVVTPFLGSDYIYLPPVEKQMNEMARENPAMLNLVKKRNEKQLLRSKKVTEWSICYIHGFTASPMELQPVVTNIAKDLRANLFVTRLSGHGLRDPNFMERVQGQNWIDDAMECLTVAQMMGNKTILMGTSFGGTLATLVTLNAPKPPDALVLVSPNFGIKDKAAFLLAGGLGKFIIKMMFGTYREFPAENKAHGYFWTTKHPAIALQEFMRVTLALKKQDYSQLHTPTLIAYSPDDEVLDVSQIKSFYNKIKPKVKLLISEPEWDRHVLAGDIVNPKGNRALRFYVTDFVNKNL